MTKKHSFDILIGLAFLGLLGLYFYDHYIIPAKVNTNVYPQITKANDILRRKTKIPEQLLNMTATSSACTLFLKNSAELSMNDYANEFIDHHIDGIIKTCAGAFPTPLQKRIDSTLSECKTSTRDNITKECYSSLIKSKTSSVAIVIKADANPSELPSQILLHLIADKFNTNDLLEHPEKNLAIIDALLDKEPNYLGGYKAKLLVLATSFLNIHEHYRNMFQDTLDDIKSLTPNDRQVTEIVLAQRGGFLNQANEENLSEKKIGKKNAQEFISYLDKKSAKHPKEWIYDYYKARTLYEDGFGNYQKTVALIENSLKKAPTNNRLKQTLANLKSEDENKKNFPFSIDMSFSLDDL